MRERDPSGPVLVQVHFTSSRASLNEEECEDGVLGRAAKNGLHPRETATPSKLSQEKSSPLEIPGDLLSSPAWCGARAGLSALCIFL